MRKKVVATLLCLSLMIGTLTGCGSNNKTSEPVSGGKESSVSTDSKESEVVQEVDDNFNETGYPIVNEQITLNVICCVGDDGNFLDSDDMPVLQRLEEQTGIHTEWEFIKKSDWETKLNLIFASEEYPDIIFAPSGKVDAETYGVDQGILVPLDELTEKYMPTYTERIAAEATDPTITLTASDGQKYSVGFLWSQDISTRSHFFINQGWMDELGLETPKNVEALTDVFRAFKTGDPNKNGVADEIPMTFDMNESDYNIGYLFNLFGLPLDSEYYKWIYLDNDKKVQFAPTKEEFRDCLEWLHQCYDEGLLDVETITQDGSMIQSKLTEGTVGFFSNWRMNGMGYDDSPTTENCVLYVPGEGTSMLRYLELAKPGAFVTKANEHIPATMRYIDAMLEEENMWNLYWGTQDVGRWLYEADGTISTTSVKGPIPSVAPGMYALFFGPSEYIKIYNAPATRVEKTEFCNEYEAQGLIQKYANSYLNMVPFNVDEQAAITLKETDIQNAVMENLATFIKNGVTDESWKTFTSILNSMNIDEYVQAYQAGIDAMNLQ